MVIVVIVMYVCIFSSVIVCILVWMLVLFLEFDLVMFNICGGVIFGGVSGR